MRIFVSSSFEDLREHRAAVIRILHQLGHEVLAMEDLTAGTAAPVSKVLAMVDRSEAYVGIFAWRYGFIPFANADAPATDPATTADASAAVPGGAAPQLPPAAPAQRPQVDGARPGTTSITHYEYLRARQRGLPIIAFLLDEQYPWPPRFVDGFDRTQANAPADAARIRELRQELQQERIVSWFTTPTDLEARVSAAVTMAGLSSQLNLLETADALDSSLGTAKDSGGREGIMKAIQNAALQGQCALKIDLKTSWWSTRLFLLAALAERFTQVRRILIVDTSPPRPDPAAAASPDPQAPAQPASKASTTKERFIGQLATGAILSIIGPKLTQLGKYQNCLQNRAEAFDQLGAELESCLGAWESTFGDQPYLPTQEENLKIDLSTDLLRRWFRDTMLTQPLRIADLQRANVVDLIRLLDYPSDFVPVLTRHLPAKEGDPVRERVDIMDKGSLNRRLARSYLLELMDRERLARGFYANELVV